MSFINIQIGGVRRGKTLLSRLLLLIQKIENMAITLDQVLESVTANKTIGESAITLLNGLKSRLDEALADSEISAETQAKIDAIFATSESDKSALEAAIVANTPTTTTPGETTEEI